MEESGLIERVPDANDRRKCILVLTERARSLQEKYEQVSQEMNDIYFQGFCDEEIKEFVCIYGKIEESVFDDGQIYINVITSRFENISQIESFIEGYDNLATACG